MPSSVIYRNELEIVHPGHPRGNFRFALFDFDGTVSLIRQGWQDVMVPMMVEFLLDTNSGEPKEEIESCVREFVERLTGEQTIYQMFQLVEEVKRRGGEPLDPLEYKRIYLERLWERIKHRFAGLKDGSIAREEMMVTGVEEILKSLRERGVSLFLASGTDVEDVVQECAVLRLSDYFNGGIYGALDDYQKFSKKIIIERIFQENDLRGSELLTFGDGYVEIENTKEVNGVAVGVASDEVGQVGIDSWKRNRLIQAGADLIIPHFGNHKRLVAYLFREV
jgi:phosphoglycolate phosphatase-like HAD superfamily hydrolase